MCDSWYCHSLMDGGHPGTRVPFCSSSITSLTVDESPTITAGSPRSLQHMKIKPKGVTQNHRRQSQEPEARNNKSDESPGSRAGD
jgi:hypothetical protein